MFTSAQLGTIISSLPDPVFVLSRSGRYVGVFGGTDSRYYHDGQGLVGQSIRDVLNPEKAAWFLSEIANALVTRRLLIVEYSLSVHDVKGLPVNAGPDAPIWFEGRVQALDFLVDGEEVVIWVASNITERHDLETKLRLLSETDALTGLHNRRHFEKTATAEMRRALRYEHPLALLIFDIDHFKLVNDTCGHMVGDEVITEIASRVLQCMRETDVVARWGGEEFTVLMPDTPLDTAIEAAEKLRLVVATQPFLRGLKVTVSIGVAQWSASTEESLDAVLARADEALYQAKKSGRNRVIEAEEPLMQALDSSEQQLLRLRWRKRYESGNAIIDAQHQDLFAKARSLCLQVAAFTGAPTQWQALLLIIDDLLRDVEEHFVSEELLQEEHDWDARAAHQDEHQNLLARAQELKAALSDNASPQAMTAFVNYLVLEVIVKHMLRRDQAFFPILSRAQGQQS